MSLLTWWMVLTAVALAGLLIWSFVPILMPVILVAGALGLVVVGIVSLARRLERSRNPGAALSDNLDPPRRARRRSELPD